MWAAKTVIIALHLSSILILWRIIYQIDHLYLKRIVVNFHARIICKSAMFLVWWHLTLMGIFWFYVDGLPISPAGLLLWPSLPIVFTGGIVMSYFAIRDESKHLEKEDRFHEIV